MQETNGEYRINKKAGAAKGNAFAAPVSQRDSPIKNNAIVPGPECAPIVGPI